MEILSGDIGGTNTRLAVLKQRPDGGFDTLRSRKVASRDFASLEGAIEDFFDSEGISIEDCPLAGFGIAGPVVDGVCHGTNFPWVVDARAVRDRLGFRRVDLLNDLEALAHGLPALGDGDFAVLHEGEPRSGNAAVIAAGTGLGEAGLFFDGEAYHPFATEGGHTDFGPRNDLELALLRHLHGRYGGRVSWERVVSGMGLVNLYEFLLEYRRLEPCAEVREALEDDDPATDPAAAISKAAEAGTCAAADRALDLFVELYGAEAGNLALKMMSVSGMYLGGGIAPRILDRLRGPRFREAFCDKGRMRPLLEAMPIRVVLDSTRAALFGAAREVRS